MNTTISVAYIQTGIRASFSKVKYKDIAPKVGLLPTAQGADIPVFPMFRARLTSEVFRKIIEDIDCLTAQYGTLRNHRNEEARSRFLTAYFNRIVELFSGLILNVPETLLEGRFATQGRIEYQYTLYGGVTVIFIEVKLDLGGPTERLNTYAQVIAECDACALANEQNGFDIPIIAVLCDGKSFSFFKYERPSPKGGAKPRFSMGKFPDGYEEEPIFEMSPGTAPRVFIQKTRRLCESLFYVFLSGYHTGLEGYCNLSMEESKEESKSASKRDSTSGWHNAKNLAKAALDKAKEAWDLRKENDQVRSKRSAEEALQILNKSVNEAPWKPGEDKCSEVYTDDIADVP
ncbi:hypothetical protein GP486_001273 [Trichoglossum hirsutum]|uniref:Uncharacterized protein n=1 Tax=Trichoglossum hirsutum TaxID=265104 RepID=A0A9P8LHG4_9PEZI|nr:hypothetical protein GP486_001273 [Trichoglossum hirsutum]